MTGARYGEELNFAWCRRKALKNNGAVERDGSKDENEYESIKIVL